MSFTPRGSIIPTFLVLTALFCLSSNFVKEVYASSNDSTRLNHQSGYRAAPSNTAVLTYKNDNNRTGQDPNETILNTSNLNAAMFGKRISYPVDGQIYAQPLFLPNVTINGGLHNVVFAETEHDSVYAFDADQTGSASPLWKTSFLINGATAVLDSDVLCNNISPEIGITSTPVIDTSTNTLYVVAYTKESGQLVYRLHALDVTTGNDKPGSPMVIQASVPGTGAGSSNGVVKFDPAHERQRSALMLANGQIYVTFASFCDTDPYHGWILGYTYSGSAFNQASVYNDSPNGTRGGIWGGDGAIAADSSGNIFFMSGNGSFDLNTGGNDAGDSFGKLNAQLSLQDYFTPFNQSCLEAADADLGSGGPLLLPNINEVIGAGKEGRPYVIDTTNMGKYTSIANPCSNQSLTNVDKIIQELPVHTTGGIFSTPAYWNGPSGQFVYFTGTADHAKAFSFTSGKLSSSPTSQTPESFGFTGGNAEVSSNGITSGTGIVWIIDPAAVLRAYDATNLSKELYNSAMISTRDALDSYVKFSTATVANGEVFVGTNSRLNIFGDINSGNTYYQIVNRNSGMVMAISGGSTSQGAQVVQWPYQGALNQQWSLVPDGAFFQLKNHGSGLILGVSGGSTSQGANLVQWSNQNALNQQWFLAPNGGYDAITNRNSSLVAAISGGSTSAGARVIQWSNQGTLDQQWELVSLSPFEIVNRNSNLVAAIAGGSTSAGAHVIQWPYTGALDQQWTLVSDGAYYQIVDVKSGLVMAISGGSTSVGAQVVQWTNQNALNQQWSLVPDGSIFQLKNRNSGLILAVSGGSTSQGANLIQWTNQNVLNQQWSLVPTIV